MLAITLSRRPVEGTVARTVLQWGTGGLNINGARIRTGAGDEVCIHTRGDTSGTKGERRLYTGGDMGAIPEVWQTEGQKLGRWPSNLMLMHLPGCRCEGTRQVGSGDRRKARPGSQPFNVDRGWNSHSMTRDGASAPESYGEETVAAWDCVEGCPVADLDRQQEHRSTDSGGASRYFFQVQQGEDMKIPQDLYEYLRTLISPPPPHGVAVYISDLATADWANIATWTDSSVTGLIVRGTPTEEQAKELMRVLKPGAHLCLIAPDAEPTGHTGACRIEDAGMEIRDTILLVDEPGGLHYVPKASRKERDAGCHRLKGKTGAEAVKRKAGSTGLDNPRAGAGRTADRVKNIHPCLHPNALVMTEWGFRPIQDIQVGDKVYAADGSFHRVECVSQHPYTSPSLYSVRAQGNNYDVPASDNHPFLIWRPTRRGNSITGGKVLWLESKDLVKGDYTMTPVLSHPPFPVFSLQNYTPDFWFIFGLYLAEGVIQKAGHGKNAYPSFTLHEDEQHLVDRIRAWAPSIGVYPKKDAKAIQVVAFHPSAGAEFLALGGHGASTKFLHPTLWGLQEAERAALLEGYLAGDGGKVRNYQQARTVSPDLASQMVLWAESLGYRTELNRSEGVLGKGIGGRKFKSVLPTYQLRIYSRNQQLTERKPSKPGHVWYNGVKYLLRYIKSVTEVPYVGDVWNLTVEGNPTFQTAVGMSHNTVKPKELMAKLLHDVPKDKGAVLDPFMGSGSTGLACLATGHDFVGIELSPEYLEIADARVRYWDGGCKEAATIKSDLAPVEEPKAEVSLDDLFGGDED